MALTRKFLKGMGLTEEQIESVIEEHTAVTNDLKDEIKKYREDADKLPGVQKELDDMKKSTGENDDWKGKYEQEHKDFEAYKTSVTAEQTLNKVKEAYKALLKSANVDDKRIDTIMKVTDFKDKKLDKDGKLEGEKDLTESIKTEWKDFIVTKREAGAPVENPLGGNANNAGLSADAAFIRQRAAARHAGTYGEVKKGE